MFSQNIPPLLLDQLGVAAPDCIAYAETGQTDKGESLALVFRNRQSMAYLRHRFGCGAVTECTAQGFPGAHAYSLTY